MKIHSIIIVFLILLSISTIPAYAQSNENKLRVSIEQIDVTDKYGHVMKNLDGTYYPGDRISFLYTITGIIPEIGDDDQAWTNVVVKTPFKIISQNKGFRIGVITVEVPEKIIYRTHITTVSVEVGSDNIGVYRVIPRAFNHQVVPYNPSLVAFPYTALIDKEHYSYQDRTGIAFNYLGSIGNTDSIFDRQVYPDRRLMLNDTRTESWSNNTQFMMQEVPVIVNGQQASVPVGIEYAIHEDVMNVTRRSNDPFIFRESAGYFKEYYNTTPTNQTLVSEANHLGIIIHYDWKPSGYESEVRYNLPSPRTALANTITITTNPHSEGLDIVVKDMDFSPERGVYQSIRQFAHDQVIKKTNDRVMAEMVELDMPSTFTRVITTKDNIEVEVPKFHVYIPEFAGQNYNFTNIPDFPSSVELSVRTDDSRYTKEYQTYNFESNYNVDIDTREGLPLPISTSLNGNVNVKAPWQVSKVEGAKMLGCLESCVLKPTSDRITVYNEFGGSATGIVPEIPKQESPFTQKVQDDLRFVLILLGVIFGGLWLLKKYASFLNRTIL